MRVKDQVDFPVLADSIANKILIVSGKADTVVDKNNAGMETIGHHYTITAFDSGEYVIPSYAFHTANGEVKTEPLKLIVATVAVDTTKAAYDIKQPLIVQYTFLHWLMAHLTLVIIIEAVILIGANTCGGATKTYRTAQQKVMATGANETIPYGAYRYYARLPGKSLCDQSA